MEGKVSILLIKSAYRGVLWAASSKRHDLLGIAFPGSARKEMKATGDRLVDFSKELGVVRCCKVVQLSINYPGTA